MPRRGHKAEEIIGKRQIVAPNPVESRAYGASQPSRQASTHSAPILRITDVNN